MKSTGLNKFRMPGNHIIVVAGHYGSGKTEIALNLAIGMQKAGSRIALIDLDIVNPFFRSAEQSELLKQHEIELLKPIYANTSVDIPSLPPQIQGVFGRQEGQVIFDVGGDDAGAAALGGYAPQFSVADKVFYMVVNPFRPRSETVDLIVSMYHAISTRARMAPDALICNANLGDQTTAQDILQGYEIVQMAADRLSVPVCCISAKEDITGELPPDVPPLLAISRYLKPEWMEV